MISKKDVLFVTAETGYVKRGLEMEGYGVIHPYRFKTLFGRVLFEVVVKLKFSQKFMFNKRIKGFEGKYVIVQDSIITRQFLEWLKKIHSDKQLFFSYGNMVGKAHHLMPSEIPCGIEVWTYDEFDSKKYNIKLCKCGGYFTAFIGKKTEKKYDVMYVGKDKGRAEYIMSLKKQFEDLGLTTKFLIMRSTRISKKKSFYSNEIPYEEIIKIVNESRAILNISLPDQKGATMRDFESIFNEVKLITTNENITSFDFYNEHNVWILNKKNMDGLPDFIEEPFEKVADNILKNYSIDAYVGEIIKCSSNNKEE